jgi:hypothetical protein
MIVCVLCVQLVVDIDENGHERIREKAHAVVNDFGKTNAIECSMVSVKFGLETRENEQQQQQ